MKCIISVLLLTVGTALATTHVNISFTQQHSQFGSKVSELKNQEEQLKASDCEQFDNEDKSNHFARIQVKEQIDKLDFDNNQKVILDIKPNRDSTSDYRSEHAQTEERGGFFVSNSQSQQRNIYNSNRELHHGQLRNLSPQDKQNREFERYIQNYHGGPTVETVYESAKSEMQHTLTTSPLNERSQRVVKFERQVALPVKTDGVLSNSDVIKPLINHQTVSPSASSTSSSTSLSSSVPTGSVVSSASDGNIFKENFNPKPSSVAKDGFKFDLNYNKPNYKDSTFKYNDRQSDSDFYNQLPPSVEEPRSGYGDYYNNIYRHKQAVDGYQTVEQRPVVTKTIQIAQPAIKAKKYEVRHPAIQKEFYDIEERVVIKPAGTVVVELERPSAKILKEETTLPLGHPHPAVAAAYMPTRNTQTFSNIIYSNTGQSSLNHPNNQYIPQQTYNNKFVPNHHTTITSPVSASSTYDQPSKEGNPQTNHNKAYIGESQFSTSPTVDATKSQNREIVVLTDGHGNQHQISTDQFMYSRDETDKSSSRPTYNHRSSFAYEDKGHASSQVNISPQRSGFQSNQDNREDFTFDAEYINNSANTNLRKETKPARLQDAILEKVIDQKQQPQPIIKHEHKIVLSPSQHNIYLNRNQEVPKTKFIDETAEVREIKPYLQRHRGSVVVYAPTQQMPELKYIQKSEYKTPAGDSYQNIQYNSQQRSQVSDSDNHVQYSAPYAQMRHHSDQDLIRSEQQHKQIFSQRKSENLILEDKPSTEMKKSTTEYPMEKQTPQAHIEIKIPNHSSTDGNKGILIDSKLRPMMMDDNHKQIHNSKLEISVTNNGELSSERNSVALIDNNDQKSNNIDINSDNKTENFSAEDSEHLPNVNANTNCDPPSKSDVNENYELAPEQNNYRQQKFMRIVESSSAVSPSKVNDAVSTDESAAVQTSIQSHDIDANLKNTVGHINPVGSRVISSTSASKESSPSESFHKRRIVVNHPFQTVREVVEHEPYTNYHEIQVNEPATPALYQSANYYQSENRRSPAYYH